MRLLPALHLHTYFRAYGFVFSLLPCALMAVFLSTYLSDRLHELFMENIRQTLRLQGQFLDTWVGDRQRDVQRLAAIKDVVNMNLQEADQSFRQFLAVMPEFRGLGLIDAQGRTVVDTIAKPGLYLGDRAYFKAGEQGRGYTSDVLVGRATGTRLIMFSSPVTGRDGAFRGVVFAPVALDIIEEVVRSSLQFDGRTLLLDRKGTVIAGGEAQPMGADDAPHPVAEAAFQDGKALRYQNPDGQEVLGVALGIQTNGWVLLGEVKTKAMQSAVYRVLIGVFAAGGVSFLLILPLLFRMTRKVEAVVIPLARHAQGVASGDYTRPGPSPSDMDNAPLELRTLSEAYETMRLKIVSDMALLENLALTDDLTRLPNRRFLMGEGLRLLEISARAGTPCSCLVIDVDHFKTVNDRFGHTAGDQVLQDLAEVFRKTVRGADLLGRLGGEEFLVICSNTGQQEALHLASRLRANVKAMIPGALGPRNITVSIGVATLLASAEDAPALFDRLILTADMAMYQAKESGRDKVVLADCDPRQSTCDEFIG